MHNVMLSRLGRCGVVKSPLLRVTRCAYSTRRPHHRETVEVPVGGSGHVEVDILHKTTDTDVRPAVLLRLPTAAGFADVERVKEATSREALEDHPYAAVVTIKYRLSSPLPFTSTEQLVHRFPRPIHDVCTSFAYLTSTILPELFPHALEEPEIDVTGSDVGGALATSLALTEPNALARVKITDPFVDWVMLDEHAGLVELPTLNKSKKAQPLVAPEVIQEAAKALIAVRTRLFPTPSSFFDPFASPMLFLRAPGRDTPRTHAEALGLVDALQDEFSSGGSPQEPLTYGPYDDDHEPDPTRTPALEGLSDSSSELASPQQTRRYKVLRRWPPVGRPEEVLLPQFSIFSTPLKGPSDGHGWLLQKQATELASYLQRACFYGRERGFAEERVRLNPMD